VSASTSLKIHSMHFRFDGVFQSDCS